MTGYNSHVIKITGRVDCCRLTLVLSIVCEYYDIYALLSIGYSLLFNSSPVTELQMQETSGKETLKLSGQVTRATAGIKTPNHHCNGGPKHKNDGWASLLLFRASCWRTVEFAVLYSFVYQSSVLFSEALVLI